MINSVAKWSVREITSMKVTIVAKSEVKEIIFMNINERKQYIYELQNYERIKINEDSKSF